MHESVTGVDVWAGIRAAVRAHTRRAIAPDGRRRAAVLLTLVPDPAEPHVLMTVRSQEVEHHKGEISFPGGVIDPGDAGPQAAALREAQEEMGIAPRDVDVLGPLDDIVTRSGFHVSPFVGVLQRAPYPYRPSPKEVAEVLEVPLSHLLDVGNTCHYTVERQGEMVIMPEYTWGAHRVTGATALMLRGFLELVAERLGLQR